MEKTDKFRFAELITGLAQTFHTPISAADLENYWRLLGNFSLASIEQAIVTYCRSPNAHRFLPKPGELVAIVQGDSAAQALLAWSKVARAIRVVGAYRSVVFDDPLIQAVIWDMGGWQALCAMSIKDEPFRAREFEKRYMHYLIRPPTSYPRQLTGITDAVNAARGYIQQAPPTLIGDLDKALHVFKGGQESGKLLELKPLSVAEFAQMLSHSKNKEDSAS